MRRRRASQDADHDNAADHNCRNEHTHASLAPLANHRDVILRSLERPQLHIAVVLAGSLRYQRGVFW
jgi:hypothetical protein